MPRGHEINNFGRPFLGHHYYYILSLSDLCSGVEKIFLKPFSLHDLHGHTLSQESLPRGHEIYNLVLDPSLIVIATYLVYLIFDQE